MRHGFQKESSNGWFAVRAARTAAVVVLSLAALSFAGCGKNEAAETSFSAAQSREEETGSAGAAASENASAAATEAETDVPEAVPE